MTDGSRIKFNNVMFFQTCRSSGPDFISINYENAMRKLKLGDILYINVLSIGSAGNAPNGAFVQNAKVEIKTKTGIVFTDTFPELMFVAVNKLDELTGRLEETRYYFAKANRWLLKRIDFDN